MRSILYAEPFDPKFPTVNDWTNSAVLGLEDSIYDSTKVGDNNIKTKKQKKVNIKKFNATLHHPRKVGKNQKSQVNVTLPENKTEKKKNPPKKKRWKFYCSIRTD